MIRWCELRVCDCCLFSHANGECCADDKHGGDGVAPWADVDFARFSVTMGGEHCDLCTDADRDEGCDCDNAGFSWQSCDGCGSALGGNRTVFTLWRERQRFPRRTVPLP